MPEIYKNNRLYGTAKAFTGATTQANGSSGLVPAPAIADKDKVLKGDGTWGDPSSGGHTIEKADGTDMTARSNLQFVGATVTDDSTNDRTVVTISGGTTDATPTQGSTNPVQSGGVYTALQDKQNTLTFDNSPTENSTNPVKSGGVYTAIANVVVTLTQEQYNALTQEQKMNGSMYCVDTSTSSN